MHRKARPAPRRQSIRPLPVVPAARPCLYPRRFYQRGLGRRRLAHLFKLIEGNTQLAADLVEERWPNFTASVQGNCNCSAVWMIPALGTTCWAGINESKESSDALKTARRRTRH